MKTDEVGLKPEGALERSHIAGAGAPSGVDVVGPKRYSVQRKLAVVARLLRGEPLELVAREANVSVAKLTEWRERALAGAASALKERERDDRDDEIARLKVSALSSPYAARLDTFRKAHGMSSSIRFCGWPSRMACSVSAM